MLDLAGAIQAFEGHFLASHWSKSLRCQLKRHHRHFSTLSRESRHASDALST